MNHIFEQPPLTAHEPLMRERPLGLPGVGFDANQNYMRDVMRALAESPDCKGVTLHGPEDHGKHGNHVQVTLLMGDKDTTRPVAFRMPVSESENIILTEEHAKGMLRQMGINI